MSLLLVGDVGATKTILALVSPEAVGAGVKPPPPLAEATFISAHYPNLQTMVRKFLTEVGRQAERAVFGVAGPVVAGRSALSNLPWGELREAELREDLNLGSVLLMNDLEAIACGVPSLGPEDLEVLNVGDPVPGGSLAVIAPGTGLGEAFLTWDGQRYRSHPSEGGHADFAPTNELELGLLRYLQERLDHVDEASRPRLVNGQKRPAARRPRLQIITHHVSYEQVCSGRGLPNIYAFLRDSGYAEEPPSLAEQLASTGDPTPIIVGAALDSEERCELCAATLSVFVAILGAEAGNLALKVLATGGVYLGGGIPPRILPALKHKRFLQAFQGKGRLSELLARIPVHVITNPRAALIGAACRGLETMPA